MLYLLSFFQTNKKNISKNKLLEDKNKKYFVKTLVKSHYLIQQVKYNIFNKKYIKL